MYGSCNKEICNYYYGDIEPQTPSQSIDNVATEQECAHAVRQKYPNATGAEWFEKDNLTYCESRYGNEFDYNSDENGRTSCLFSNPCTHNSDCARKNEMTSFLRF